MFPKILFKTNFRFSICSSIVLHAPPYAQHKSTLNDAEIQNAVEAAAVIFKKVVLQRRRAKQDEGEYHFLFISI